MTNRQSNPPGTAKLILDDLLGLAGGKKEIEIYLTFPTMESFAGCPPTIE